MGGDVSGRAISMNLDSDEPGASPFKTGTCQISARWSYLFLDYYSVIMGRIEAVVNDIYSTEFLSTASKHGIFLA